MQYYASARQKDCSHHRAYRDYRGFSKQFLCELCVLCGELSLASGTVKWGFQRGLIIPFGRLRGSNTGQAKCTV